MGSPARAPAPPLAWQEAELQDDQGRGARRETVWVAHDAHEHEWIVAPHDDGSWNWMRWDGPAPLDMGPGYQDAGAARAGADAYARKILGARR